jgi:hypothetical protein
MKSRELRIKMTRLYLEYIERSNRFADNGSVYNLFKSRKILKNIQSLILELKRELTQEYRKTKGYQKKYGENGTRVEILKNLELKYGKSRNKKT